jgi:hypothetical protein
MKIQFKRAVTVAIGLLAALSAAIAPTAAQASVKPAKASAAATWECAGTHNGNQHLAPGGEIYQGGYECAGNYEWIVQSNGNFVEYLKSKADVIWATNKATGLPSSMIMQSGGNFIESVGLGATAWSTGTNGHSGAYVCFQIDGNLVVYAETGLYNCAGTALWANGH